MIASPQQVVVRILTGLHAGAEILLSHGTHEIGSDINCTIVISDWPVLRSLITMEKDHTGTLCVRLPDANETAPFGMHEPIRFGNIVIVASDVDNKGRQPTDLELLTRLLVPVAQLKLRKLRKAGAWVVGGIMIAVVIAGTVILQSPRSVAATNARTVPTTTLEQVRKTVAQLRYSGVYVAMDGERIAVAGIVKNQAEAKNLAMQLSHLQLEGIEHRYAVESDIAAAISDAIARPGISVKHLGAGRFEIRGEIPPSVMQRIDLKRLKTDLGSVVSSIIFQENVSAIPIAEEATDFQNKDDYQFRQGGDGVKYFSPK